MRHETADAARRESSKTVEFFEIGALQQKLCLRDADAVHRVHCDSQRPLLLPARNGRIASIWLIPVLDQPIPTTGDNLARLKGVPLNSDARAVVVRVEPTRINYEPPGPSGCKGHAVDRAFPGASPIRTRKRAP